MIELCCEYLSVWCSWLGFFTKMVYTFLQTNYNKNNIEKTNNDTKTETLSHFKMAEAQQNYKISII